MPADPAGVSVVVLSFNRPRLLREALTSLQRQSRPPADVIVIDNYSPASAEVAAIVHQFPGYRLVANPENLGFTGGMNEGLGLASQPFIYLTEDDVVLDPDCLEALVRHAQRAPGRGLLSGVMVDAERDTILSAGGTVTLGRVYRQDIVAQGEPVTRPFGAPYQVNYIPGAMMFAHRDVWRRLGGFREDFFVYSEDAELCLRARRAGYQITVVPAARVRHLGSGDGTSEVVQFHKHKNFFALYLLHARPLVLPEFFLRYALLGFLRTRGDGSRAVLRRALAWNLKNLPTLLRDRGRLRPSTARRW